MRSRLLALTTVTMLLALAPSALAAPPSVTTRSARNVTSSSATLRGTVNPNGSATTYFFQYGTTNAYGSQTPTQGPTAANNQSIAVAANVAGLVPGTTYHFRLVATNASGTRTGGDQRFTTPAGLSLTVQPNPLTWGQTALIEGTLVAGQRVGVTISLHENPYPFTAPKTVATTTTDANGHYAFNRTPAVNTLYQATANRPSARSAVVAAFVRPRISIHLSSTRPRRGARVTFSGQVLPSHAGRLVLIQRLDSGRWHTVGRALLVATTNPVVSKYRVSLRIRHSASYRAHLAHDADHAATSTGRHRVLVH